MTSVRLFNHPLVLWQTADEEFGVANEAIALHVDNGNTICLEQEGRTICLNRATVPELVKLLKQLAEQK